MRAQQACQDAVSTLYAAFSRCGEGVTREEVEATATGATCASVVEIRNETELRQSCFSELNAMDCEELATSGLPTSCRNQLLTSG